MTGDEKAKFMSFVAEAGEVDTQTLPGLVEQAHLLVELCDDGRLIGTAALKNPNAAYRKRAFEKAKAIKKPENFPLELGWIAVHDDCRRQGHGKRLVKESLCAAASSPVYATTKNDGMKSILTGNGLVSAGEPYQSALDSSACITLYCYH